MAERVELGHGLDTFLHLEGVTGLVLGEEFLEFLQQPLGLFSGEFVSVDLQGERLAEEAPGLLAQDGHERFFGFELAVAILVGDEHLASGARDCDTAGHVELALAVGEVERCGQGFQFGLVQVQCTSEGFDLGRSVDDPSGNRGILALRIRQERVTGPAFRLLLGDGAELDFAEGRSGSGSFLRT